MFSSRDVLAMGLEKSDFPREKSDDYGPRIALAMGFSVKPDGPRPEKERYSPREI